MTPVAAEEVRAFLLSYLRDSLAAKGIDGNEIGDDFDMLEHGLIDSVGLLELVGIIEEHFSLELDLEDLDPEQLTIVGPLCRCIESQSRGRASDEERDPSLPA